MNLLNKAKYVMSGEEGASNVEIIVWISVVLVIATALFLFRNQITKFIAGAGKQVDTMTGGLDATGSGFSNQAIGGGQ